MIHGRVQTFDFLHLINLAFSSNCLLCGLHLESLDHLRLKCPNTGDVWDSLERLLNTKFDFGKDICNEDWILKYNSKFMNLENQM